MHDGKPLHMCSGQRKQSLSGLHVITQLSGTSCLDSLVNNVTVPFVNFREGYANIEGISLNGGGTIFLFNT